MSWLTAGYRVWKTRTDKMNAEVLTLTYGTLVTTLCRDLTLPHTAQQTDYRAVNAELDRMGYNVGLRLIEEFLAKSNTGHCANFREVAEMISKVGFKMFLNVTPDIKNWQGPPAGDEKAQGQGGKPQAFTLVLEENPLAEFVELPDDGRAQDELWYSNILCGVIRGALEMVSARQPGRNVLEQGFGWVWEKRVANDDARCRFRCRLRHTLPAMYCVGMIRRR